METTVGYRPTVQKKKRGRYKYTLPYKYSEFEANYDTIIKENIMSLISIFDEDSKEITRLKNVKLGIQSIYNNSVTSTMFVANETKTDQNEMWAITNFWKDALVGEPISYSLKTSSDSDDIAILNRYFTDISKPIKDIETINDVITTGIGYQFILPTTKKEIDIQYEAPFYLEYLDNETAFIVYSTNIIKEVLFSCIVSTKQEEDNTYKNVYTIYFPNKVVTYEESSGVIENVKDIKQPFNFQPVIEYTMTPERVGVITPVESLQDSENDVNSSQVDLLKQQANPPLVLLNVELDVQPGETIEAVYSRIRRTNTIAAKTQGMAKPEIYYLEQKKDTASSTQLFDRVHKSIYDISATPQASGNVTSGGDTGQARAFGNGWQNSFLRAKSYITFFASSQTQVLKNVLECCKLKGENNPLKNSHATDIDVTFNTSVFDSILIKAQAYADLIGSGVSAQEASKATGITTDPANFSKKVEEQQEKDQAELEATAVETTTTE